MSNMEIFIIICACLIPIVALVVLFPKIKLKKKEKSAKSNENEQTIEKYIPDKPIVEEPKIVKKNEGSKYDRDDFKDYLKSKGSRVAGPQRKILPEDFRDLSTDYNPRGRLNQMQNSNQTSIADEINSLSPELKALILSGALEKKTFDEE